MSCLRTDVHLRALTYIYMHVRTFTGAYVLILDRYALDDCSARAVPTHANTSTRTHAVTHTVIHTRARTHLFDLALHIDMPEGCAGGAARGREEGVTRRAPPRPTPRRLVGYTRVGDGVAHSSRHREQRQSYAALERRQQSHS